MLLKTLVTYLHLLATCIALGSVLLADHRLWRQRHSKPDARQLQQLQETQQVVSLALLALWLTGAALVGLGYLNEGLHYLQNPKLWVKVSVVILLTGNGWLLHRHAFPLLQRCAFSQLPFPQQLLLGALGSLSSSAWLFAAFLGIARPWNHNLSYLQISGVFAVTLTLALLSTYVVLHALRRVARGPVLSTTR